MCHRIVLLSFEIEINYRDNKFLPYVRLEFAISVDLGVTRPTNKDVRRGSAFVEQALLELAIGQSRTSPGVDRPGFNTMLDH